MKRHLIILISILFFACNKTEKTIPTEMIVIPISKSDTISGDFIAIIDPKFELSINDKKQIDKLLLKCVQEYNLEHEDYPIDLRYYKRQYFPKFNELDEKVIDVFCMCQTIGDNWKTARVEVNDGGKCFFKISINISTLEISKLKTNGRV